MADALVICPLCGRDGCYKTPINETAFAYFGWCCGFQTNDLMKKGEFLFEEYEKNLPELHKDAKTEDSESRVWYPVSINMPEKGTVFLNGKNLEEAHWAAIKTVPLSKEEMAMPKYKNQTFKSDASTLKSFGGDFIEACDYVGVFDIP